MTTTKEKLEMATIAVETMKKEYGFAPAKNKIVWLECGTNHGEFDYIMFSVRGSHYEWQIRKQLGVWRVEKVGKDREWTY